MDTILAEGVYGTGGNHNLMSSIKSLARPRLGMAATPFDWTTGVKPTDRPPIKNQNGSYSCGGQAKSYLIGNLLGTEVSAKSIYSQHASSGGGMFLQDLEKDDGALYESQLASYENGNPPSELFMEDKTWLISNPNLSLKGYKAVSVSIDIESIAEAIRDHGSVVWLIQAQNNGTWLTATPKPPTSNSGLWGHYMCSHKAGGFMNNGVRTIPMLQSWGNAVGENGLQLFTEEYINSGYIIGVVAFIKTDTFVFKTPFGLGSTLIDVIHLQERLGMPKILQAQRFGPLTFSYVLKFQRANNIPTTGFVGPLTMQALNK